MPRTTTKNEYSTEIIKCPCLPFGRRENSYKTQHSKSQFRAFFPLTKQNVKKEILKGTDSNFSTKLNPNYQSNGKLFENENSLICET